MNSRSRLLALLTLLAVVLVTELLYLPAAAGGFLSDDFRYLDQAQILPWLGHRSLPSLLFSGFYVIFGPNPLPYHLWSLFLHLAVASLLALWVKQITADARAAAAAGLLFAVIPGQAEAVVWISAHADLLAAGLTLWSLIAYHQFIRAGKWPWLAATLGLSAAALFSDNSAFALPALIPLLDLTLSGFSRPDRPRLLAWISVFGLALLIGAIRWFLPAPGGPSTPIGPIIDLPLNWAINLFNLVLPKVPQGKPAAAAGLWTLAVLGIMVLGLVRAWRTPQLLTATLFLLLAAIPGSLLGKIGPESELSSILYFPSLGLAALLGIALTRDRSWPSLAVGVPAFLVALILSWWSVGPLAETGKLSLRLAKDFQTLAVPLQKGDALLVAGVPVTFHGAPFHPNSYTLSVALSLARFPEEFRRRGPQEKEQLPLLVISAMTPATEAELLPLPRLRRLKSGVDQDFRYRLIWQYLQGTFKVIPP